MEHKSDCKTPDLMQIDLGASYVSMARIETHLIEVKKKLLEHAKDGPGFDKNFDRIKEFIKDISLRFFRRHSQPLIIPNIALLDDDSIDLEWMVGESDFLMTFSSNLAETILVSGGNSKDFGFDGSSDYPNLAYRIIGWMQDFKRNRSTRCVSCNALFETKDLRKP